MEGEKVCYDGTIGKLKKPARLIEKKRRGEKLVISHMISLYCKGNKHVSPLCPNCKELLDYAYKKIDGCPFMETKTFCSSCRVHCYEAAKREAIQKVMKYAGPRMLYVHPVLAIKHVAGTIKHRKEEIKRQA